MLDAAVAYLGWVRQREMRREPAWQNVDMNIGDLLGAVGADALIAVQQAYEEQAEDTPGSG